MLSCAARGKSELNRRIIRDKKDDFGYPRGRRFSFVPGLVAGSHLVHPRAAVVDVAAEDEPGLEVDANLKTRSDATGETLLLWEGVIWLQIPCAQSVSHYGSTE